MITAPQLEGTGLANRYLHLFDAVYPQGMKVNNDNVLEMAAFGINIRAVAEAVFSDVQMGIFRSLTEPTIAWYRNSIRSAENKLKVRDSLIGTLLAIEASMFVRLYRLSENTLTESTDGETVPVDDVPMDEDVPVDDVPKERTKKPGPDIIEVKRNAVRGSDIATFGEIFVNKESAGVTLEPPPKECIKTGTYKAAIYESPKHGRTVILLKDVPGRTYIEIHQGNYLKDTEGCILVGKYQKAGAIWHSIATLNKIVKSLKTPNDLRVVVG